MFLSSYNDKITHLLNLSLIVSLLSSLGCKPLTLSFDRKEKIPLSTAPLRQPVEILPANGVITVRKNDSVFVIATRYQVTPQSIIKRNSLSPPFTLREGQLLKISPRRTHIVRVTDSIYSISQRYAVSQFQLAQLNELEPPFELQVGQQLQLPNTQDFSVLETGLPSGVSSTNVVQPKPTSTNATPSLNKRKRFVAPTENDNGFRWPVEGEIVKEFGPSARGIHNDGINIAAKEGMFVGAAAKGRVAFVGDNIKSFGKLILIKHDDNIITAYAHLGKVIVKEGELVSTGQKIGTIGMSGRVDQPQLHFEIRKSRKPIDPRALVS